MHLPKFSKDDIAAINSIICTVLGVGALTMGKNLAQAGPIVGVIAIVGFGSFNIYTPILLCRCFDRAPNHVQTYAELGEYIAGKAGRWLVLVMQLGTCFILPIVYMILSGELLLPSIFEGVITLQVSYWVIIYVCALLPIMMNRNMQEAGWAMILGLFTALFAFVMATGESALVGSWADAEPTEFDAWNSLGTFGSVSLAYAAAIVIPTLYREHPNPKNMSTIITLSVAVATVIYIAVGAFSFAQHGCNAPANVLISMTSRVPKTLAYISMLLHVSVSSIVIMSPFFYFIEAKVLKLGMHKAQHKLPQHTETAYRQQVATIENSDSITRGSLWRNSIIRSTERGHGKDAPSDVLGAKERIVSILSRTLVLMLQGFIAIMLQSSFNDVADFAGATTISCCCVIIPCAFYYKLFRKELNFARKALIAFILVVSLFCGVFAAYKAMENIIANASRYRLFQEIQPGDEAPLTFPYCAAGYAERHPHLSHLQ